MLCYVYTWSQQQIGVCQYPEYLEEAEQIQSLKKIGCGRSLQEIAALKERARLELSKFEKQPACLFLMTIVLLKVLYPLFLIINYA